MSVSAEKNVEFDYFEDIYFPLRHVTLAYFPELIVNYKKVTACGIVFQKWIIVVLRGA